MSRHITWLALVVLLTTGLTDRRVQSSADQQSRGSVATCLKVEGALLEQTKSGFTAIKAGDSIEAEKMLIGLPAAELLSANKRAKIGLLLHMGDNLPVTEAAIVLHENRECDADLSIDRGVISLHGMQAKDDVRIKIRGGKQAWELTFKDPDTTVLVARFGRHEPGTKLFRKEIKKDAVDAPLMHVGLLILKGRVTVNTGSDTFALQAPPGPAMITWDSSSGIEIKHHDKLPDEVQTLDTTQMKNYKEVCDITAKLAAGDLGKGLDGLVTSANPVQRRVAVACMGAVDDLPRLWAALENTKNGDVRDQAVITLRNWIGRDQGYLSKLNDHLSKSKNYNPIQAKNILVLLKGFDDEDRKEPIVYQLLIGALEHGPVAIRELAHWNLERLVPAGLNIAFDAASDDAARQKAVAQWRQLIPEGQLPPAPKKDEIKKGK